MFKSFSDSIRSFLHPKSNEAGSSPNRKRKLPTDDTDENDSDVEIVSVKKPRTGDASPGFFSLLTQPVSMMSEWVRKKITYQDPFHSRPVARRGNSWRKSDVRQEVERAQLLPGSASNPIVVSTNGSSSHASGSQGVDSLARPPLHSRNGTDVNGECVITRQPTASSSAHSSRRSSISSSRAGFSSRRSTVDQCYQLKEREQYLKLLQQHTTVDLGYHKNHSRAPTPSSSRQQLPHYDHQNQIHRPLSHPPVPYSNSSQITGRFGLDGSRAVSVDSLRLPPRIQAAPGRVLQASTSLSSYAQDGAVSTASVDTFLVPRLPGRGVPTHSTPVTRRMLRNSEQRSADQRVDQRVDKTAAEPSQSKEPDVEIVGESEIRETKKTPSELRFKSSEYLDEQWLKKVEDKYAAAEKERQKLIKEAEMRKKLLEERREGRLGNLDKRLRDQMRLFDEEPEVIEETPLPEVPQKEELPPLTDEMECEVKIALDGGPPSQVLVEGFRLQITRADMATLRGLNWLNDEVINFYMNMLMERGGKEGFYKTYAFNTFFYPKLIGGGHSAVKRWTRRVDIFDHHYIVIPVHLGVHWCLCVVFMKQKKICYYDSMGGNNDQCLNAVRQYLYDESMEKKKEPLDLSQWSTEVVKDIPQQMNGSDCGMFSCMYAESITRGAKITFTQKDMPYFRRRMVYEILKKKLL